MKKIALLALLPLFTSCWVGLQLGEDPGPFDLHKPSPALTRVMIFNVSILDSAKADIIRVEMDLSRVTFGFSGSEIMYYVSADSGLIYIVTIKTVRPAKGKEL